MGFIDDLKAVFTDPATPATAPPWQDRQQEAAYTTPSGNRFTFDFTDVSYSVEKRTAAFNFPDADGTYIQSNGKNGGVYPLRIFFSGDEYDIQSDLFMTGLLEDGFGKLEHPVYGTHNVVPFGKVRRRDDLVTAANQAIFEAVFWETTGIIYPLSQDDSAARIVSLLDGFNDASSYQFASQIDLDSSIEKVSFKDKYENFLDKTEAVLGVIAGAQEDVNDKFQGIVDSINRGIDVLIDAPLMLAFQTKQLIQAPGRALTSIVDRLNAYKNLAADIFGATDALALPNVNDSRNTNNFHNQSLYASSSVAGSVISVLNNTFTTKTQALAAAQEVLAQAADLAEWQDANYASIGASDPVGTSEIDTGEGYQHLQSAVALTAGYLVQLSFSLKQEREIVLDRARTIIDLESELYGTVDVNLDFLITSNNLSGSEILELPRGKKIVYYVQN